MIKTLLPPIYTNFENAYLIEDYPYGYTLRTQMKVWVEFGGEKKGFRYATCTLNPKTGQWNKPKYGTYYRAIIMYLDEKGYIQYNALSDYDVDKTGQWLSDYIDFLPKPAQDWVIKFHAGYVAYKELNRASGKEYYTRMNQILRELNRMDLSFFPEL